MLGNFVKDFRDAMVSADSLRPSVQGRKQIYHPGIGPHSELHAVPLTVDQMKLSQPHPEPMEAVRPRDAIDGPSGGSGDSAGLQTIIATS